MWKTQLSMSNQPEFLRALPTQRNEQNELFSSNNGRRERPLNRHTAHVLCISARHISSTGPLTNDCSMQQCMPIAGKCYKHKHLYTQVYSHWAIASFYSLDFISSCRIYDAQFLNSKQNSSNQNLKKKKKNSIQFLNFGKLFLKVMYKNNLFS